MIAWVRLSSMPNWKIVGSGNETGNFVGQRIIAMIQRKALGWFIICMQLLALCSVAVALSILYSQF